MWGAFSGVFGVFVPLQLTTFFTSSICARERRSYNGGSATMDVEQQSEMHERWYGGAGSLVLEI